MDNSSLLERDGIDTIFTSETNIFSDNTYSNDVFSNNSETNQSGNGSELPIIQGDLEVIETSEIKVAESVFGIEVHSYIGSDNSTELSSIIGSFFEYQTDSLSGGTSSVNSESAYWETSTIEEDNLLKDATTIAIADLTEFTNNPDFLNNLQIPFGDDFSENEAIDVIDSLIDGEANTNLEIVKIDNLETDAAFAPETGTIYISQDFLEENQQNPENVSAVILEEWGHYIDSILNDTDSAGDEGEIFASQVKGYNFDLDALQAEDDTTVLTIDGNNLLIEQAATGRISLPTTWVVFESERGSILGFKSDTSFRGLTDVYFRNGTTGIEEFAENQQRIEIFDGQFIAFSGISTDINPFNGRVEQEFRAMLDFNAPLWTRIQ